MATGEAPAAAQRTVRNPWKRSCFNTPAPRGRRKRRAQASFRRPKNLLRPAGAKKGGKPRPLFPHPLSTGSASGRRAAPPLHPWLQSAAPLGLKRRTPAGTQAATRGLSGAYYARGAFASSLLRSAPPRLRFHPWSSRIGRKPAGWSRRRYCRSAAGSLSGTSWSRRIDHQGVSSAPILGILAPNPIAVARGNRNHV